MKIKVCGIARMDQLLYLQEINADYAGLIFYPGSKRFIGNSINKQEAKAIEMAKVGVFVNTDAETIKAAVDDYALNAVQLHGAEKPELCAELRKHATVIKALPVNSQLTLNESSQAYVDSVDYLLFDTGSGGTGQKWNWQLLNKYTLNKEFFLSGGIGPQDAAAIKALKHPLLYAADINSGFETAPGVKDLLLVQNFIKELQS